jgi:hypothetical protein
MITDTKFYQPTLAKLTSRELMFAQESLGKRYRLTSGLHAGRDVPGFDFAAPGTAYPVMTRRVALESATEFDPFLFDMGPFQITYNFSRALRRNNFPVKNALPVRPRIMGEYGAAGWSFRMLYEFLCEVYNGGVPFIDTYFERVFKTRPVYRDLRAIYDTVQDDINTEHYDLYMALPKKLDGTPDMRYTASKKFMDFKVWQDPIVRQDCKLLAKKIREDIGGCLRSGRLPLRGKEGAVVSRRTKAVRDGLGGMASADRLFYASGQLIEHLNIYVAIGEGRGYRGRA